MTEEFSINNEQMGKRIRELREKEGLTQDALSEILSVGPKYFGVSTDYLLYGETENVEDIMEQVDHFSDADKLKILVRLMHYFIKGNVLTKEDKACRDHMKVIIDQLFESEE